MVNLDSLLTIVGFFFVRYFEIMGLRQQFEKVSFLQLTTDNFSSNCKFQEPQYLDPEMKLVVFNKFDSLV